MFSYINPYNWKNSILSKMTFFTWTARNMRSTRKKLTILTLILSAIAFLYFGLRTVWLQVQIRHLKLEKNYLDGLIEATKIELKSVRTPTFNTRLLKQNLSLNDSEIPLPVSQVKSLRVSNLIEWYHWTRLFDLKTG